MAAPLQAFLQEIDSTIAQSNRDRRASMLRHLTDFFVVGANQYSDEEIALIDDVFVRLVSAIEESSRALLAIRLGPLSNAPPRSFVFSPTTMQLKLLRRFSFNPNSLTIQPWLNAQKPRARNICLPFRAVS
jgi:hypothetical protein